MFDLSSIASNHEAFSNLVQLQVEQKTKFIQAGILSRSQGLDDFCNGKVNTYTDAAVKLMRSQQWSGNKLEGYACPAETGYDAIADRLSSYESRRLQIVVLSVISGAFAGDVDTTLDASGTDFVAGVTQFTAESFFDCSQILGDLQENPLIFSVHTALFNRLNKNGLIDFCKDPATGDNIPTFMNNIVVFGDNMPKMGNVFDSYLFGPGALEIGWETLKNATEVEHRASDIEGLGNNILHRNWAMSIHPFGHTFTGLREKGGPTNAVLAQVDSWSRTVDRSKVKMARLRTREA